jgi:hypothetical protein
MPRPDIKSGLPLVLNGSQHPGGKAFNPAAFTTAPSGQQGDLGRNVLRGFGAWQADLGLQRSFPLTEKLLVRFHAEFFNIFNHPNFGNPNNILTSALFGQSTQTLAASLSGGNNAGFNPLYQIGGPRSIPARPQTSILSTRTRMEMLNPSKFCVGWARVFCLLGKFRFWFFGYSHRPLRILLAD